MSRNRVAIFSPYFLLTRGGHEVCAAVMIRTLNRLGIVPDVHCVPPAVTEIPTAKRDIETAFGMSLEFTPLFLLSEKFAYRGIARRYRDVTFYQALPALIGRYRWIFDFSLGLPVAANRGAYLAYWNFNEEVLTGYQNILEGRHRRVTPVLSELVARRRRMLLHDGGYRVVVNSQYSAALARRFVPGRISVVYPPVRLDAFRTRMPGPRSGVVMWSRFDPVKRQMDAVKLLESLGEEAEGVQLTLCGSTRNAAPYYSAIRNYITEHGLTNVRVIPDPTFEQAREALSQALISLHMAENETFGISTAEAIAAGCIPIVHDSGGQREVVSTPELRYATPGELRRILLECISTPEVHDRALSELRNHIQTFSEDAFSEDLLRLAGLPTTYRQEWSKPS